MIEVKNLVKKYGNKIAVNGVSFSLEKGEVLGFLGQNGAGKSTTMNIITGYLSSNSGTVTVDGSEIYEKPVEVKSKIGYLPEIPPLYVDMTVKEYLSFMFDLKKVKLPKKEHLKDICDKVRILDIYNKLIKNLSKGYKQRVGMAQALLGDPPILILDEPTAGLDPNQIIEMRNLIKQLGKKHTVILSSHVLSEIQAVCDRIIVINQGRIVANDTTENLSKNLSADNKTYLSIEGDKNAVENSLRAIEGVINVENFGLEEDGVFKYVVESDLNTDTRRSIFKTCCENGYIILSMKNESLTLEDIFLKLTNSDEVLAEEIIEKGGEE